MAPNNNPNGPVDPIPPDPPLTDDPGLADSLFDGLNEGSSLGGTLSTEPGFEDEEGLAEERRMSRRVFHDEPDERLDRYVSGTDPAVETETDNLVDVPDADSVQE